MATYDRWVHNIGYWSSEVRAQSGLHGKRKWPLLMALFSLSLLSLSFSLSGLFTFLPERGISEQSMLLAWRDHSGLQRISAGSARWKMVKKMRKIFFTPFGPQKAGIREAVHSTFMIVTPTRPVTNHLIWGNFVRMHDNKPAVALGNFINWHINFQLLKNRNKNGYLLLL
jgi:hypothetical protein